MKELRCKQPECSHCSQKGKLLARLELPHEGAEPLGITIELVCPYNKRKKVLFSI